MDTKKMKKIISDAFDKAAAAGQYILVCSCGGQGKRATEAYELLFPGAAMPPVVRGRGHIHKLAEQTGNQHIEAISKLSGKYAYYERIDENGKIVEEYNLMNGRRTA